VRSFFYAAWQDPAGEQAMARIIFFRVPENFKAPAPCLYKEKSGKVLVLRRAKDTRGASTAVQRLRGVNAE
jgi:hypothetical protein